MSSDESMLVARASSGDERAIRSLYDQHAPRMYAVMRRIAGDDTVAQDWCQEAWIRVIDALPTFRAEARVGTWLFRIAFNTAISLRRRRASEWRIEDEHSLSHIASHGNTDDALLLRVGLESALARLPSVMRTVLVLHDVEGYKHEEIAEMLGVQPGTSRSQLFKARVRMQQLMNMKERVR